MSRIRFVVVVLALALIVVFVAGGAGQTQGPGGEEPTAMQSGTASTDASGRPVEVEPSALESTTVSLRVPAAALRPHDSDVDWHGYYEWPDQGCVYASAGDQYTAWMAPLYLPDGANISGLRMYYNDEHTDIDCGGYLTVFDAWGGIVVQWPVQSSGSTGEGYADNFEIDHIVDYDQYSYVLKWYPNVIGENMQVCGFRVWYDAPWGLALLPHLNNGE